MKTFSELSLPSTLQESLKRIGFEVPTPIQSEAIPVVLSGKDLIGLAQTGTGKTAAFGIPLVAKLIEKKNLNALILVPTRELATQVYEVLRDLTRKNPEIKAVNLIGGKSLYDQAQQLRRGYRILVATPGRLIDHLQRNSDLLKNAQFIVMDEADRMLDMGFAPQLKQIYPHMPENRQMLLFSATFSKEISQLAAKILKNPSKIQVGEISTPVDKIEQKAIFIAGDLKSERLLEEINSRKGSILVFVRTKRRADKVSKFLMEYGVEVATVHGDKTQGQRNQALNKFKNEECRILCATDLVARGIDISHVAHVINYDLPSVAEDYVHRIGRTARNGRSGSSLAFIASDEKRLWKAIENLIKQKGALPVCEKHQSKGLPAKPVLMAKKDVGPKLESRSKTEPRENSRENHRFFQKRKSWEKRDSQKKSAPHFRSSGGKIVPRASQAAR